MAAAKTKSESAFRTIGEAADMVGVAQHVLRFWETRFPQLQPLKRGGGRRYYCPADMAMLETIKAMLHDEGLTIRGAQQVLSQRLKDARTPDAALITTVEAPSTPSEQPLYKALPTVPAALSPASRQSLYAIRDRLTRALAA